MLKADSSSYTRNCNSSSGYNGQLTDDKSCIPTNCQVGFTNRAMKMKYMPLLKQFEVGSPLLCQGQTGWALRGLLSRRGSCDVATAANTRPDVFTRIETSQSWIENTIPALRLNNEL